MPGGGRPPRAFFLPKIPHLIFSGIRRYNAGDVRHGETRAAASSFLTARPGRTTTIQMRPRSHRNDDDHGRPIVGSPVFRWTGAA
jgi:hypothetical protein